MMKIFSQQLVLSSLRTSSTYSIRNAFIQLKIIFCSVCIGEKASFQFFLFRKILFTYFVLLLFSDELNQTKKQKNRLVDFHFINGKRRKPSMNEKKFASRLMIQFYNIRVHLKFNNFIFHSDFGPFQKW